jgi:hypothetical protein
VTMRRTAARTSCHVEAMPKRTDRRCCQSEAPWKRSEACVPVQSAND